MATLIQIGNSKGVRIPKALIEKAKLANVEIALEVVPQGLLLHPIVVKPRQNWEFQIQEDQSQYNSETDDGLLTEQLNHNDDIDGWQW